MKTIKRLLEEFIPSTYNLSLDISNRSTRTFTGTVVITGNKVTDNPTLSLHAKGLTITSALIDDQAATFELSTDDELRLIASSISKGEHRLKISFSGNITDPMNGLYPCYFYLDGHDEEILATQFESHHAREVFPCIDEPAAKATFDLELITEKGITVIANTPIKTQHDANNTIATIFETTPRMSTYLLAFVAGKLAHKEATTKNGVKVRTYATPDKVEKTSFALDVAVKTLDFFNEYFAIDYPLAKCDLIGLPDFSSGAMENWGCITFRESCYLVDEYSSIAIKQYAALVVAHELAHQWFGNLVTMQWWDDLWLNESFATCIEYLAIDQQFPDWQLWTQFYDNETAHALDRDSLATVQRVRQPVSDPEEIRTLFDGAIVYAKGASLLRMLHEYVGAENFRDGLRVYLDRHQYHNAEASDLWQALSEVSGKNIERFMQPWISQAGHPVVMIEAQDDARVHLSQERFLSNPKEKADPTTLWPIPLLSNGQIDTEILENQQADFQVTSTDLPFFLNQGHTGFYLTQYNQKQLQALAVTIQDGKLGIVDRLGLLSEAYDLAKAGRQSTGSMLTLLAAYRQESAEPVWGAISSAIGALKLLVNEDPTYKPRLQHFVANLAQLQFQRLGWEAIQDEPYFDALLRPSIIGLMSYAEGPAVIAHALKVFREAKQPEDIWGNIRGTIMVVAARNGTQADFDRVKNWYHTQTSAELRIQLAAGLSATRNTQNIQGLLAALTTKAIKLQDLFYWFIYLIRNPAARQLTWDWMVKNWEWIEEKFKNDMHYDDFSTYAASAFSTAEELAQYKDFFEPRLDNPALKRSILQGVESIESRLLWRERDLSSVQDFLTDQAAKQ